MTSWTPLSFEEIEAELARAVTDLHPAHAKRFSAITVAIRTVPVAAHPGERVGVVAEHQGRILYYSTSSRAGPSSDQTRPAASLTVTATSSSCSI